MLNNLNIALEWYTKSFIGETHFTFVDWLCKLHELKDHAILNKCCIEKQTMHIISSPTMVTDQWSLI